MAANDANRLMEVLVLYIVNVFQPCASATIASSLRQSPEFAKLDEDKFLRELEKKLKNLSDAGYILRTSEGMYLVSFEGKQILSSKRIAFPRDKHRLYYLKEALKRRGRE